MLVADVWESEEQLRRFLGRVGEVIAETGAPQVEPRVFPVHNLIRRDAGTGANVFLVIEADGFTPQYYDEITARMPAHARDGSGHPAVSHAAATSDGGMVFVDVWDSAESFGRFAEEQLATAAGDLDTSALRPRSVPIHNRIAV